MEKKSRVEALLEQQRGVVAAWQVIDAGGTHRQLSRAIRSLRPVFDGVWVSGHAPLTDWQRRKAGTLTAPGRGLFLASAAAHVGFRSDVGEPVHVVRQGEGGPQLLPTGPGHASAVKVHRRRSVSDVVAIDGIATMAPPRTVLELVAIAPAAIADRIVRDAFRLRAVSPQELRDILAVHHGARGTATLRRLVDRYGHLDLHRTRSDPEALGLTLVVEAFGPGVWRVNRKVAGLEADLICADRRLIVEIDGPRFHLFRIRDAEKQATWEAAGWVVRRIPTGDVYASPNRLLTLAAAPVTDHERQTITRTRSAADVLARWDAGRP